MVGMIDTRQNAEISGASEKLRYDPTSGPQAFRTGSERPNGEGTEPAYWSTKESANASVFGLVYMWASR